MLYYVLICLCLVLTGVAGLQLSYMFYLDRLDKERKKRLQELERRCKILSKRLEDAEAKIELQEAVLDTFYEDKEMESDEVWADIIDIDEP
jgi:hypothetical protein